MQQLTYLNDEVLSHIQSAKEKDDIIMSIQTRLLSLEKDNEEQSSNRQRLEGIVKSLRIRNKELYDDYMKSKLQQKEFEKKLETLSKNPVIATPSKLLGGEGISTRNREVSDPKEIEENEEIVGLVEELERMQASIEEVSYIPSVEDIIRDAMNNVMMSES